MENYTIGLIGWWKLNEGIGNIAYDSSGNGNNGNLENSPSWTTGKNYNNALSFNGTNQYISISNNGTIFNFTTANFSLSCWFKTSVTGTVLSNTPVIMGLYNVLSYYMLKVSVISGNDANVGLDVRDMSAQEANAVSGTINDGNWHHVVGVRSGDEILLYIDGSFVNSDSASLSSIVTPCSTFFIGGINTSASCASSVNSQYYEGQLGDVRIYNIALTAPEITEIYQFTSLSSGMFTLLR